MNKIMDKKELKDEINGILGEHVGGDWENTVLLEELSSLLTPSVDVESLSGNKQSDENLIRGFYEFVKQGGYFDEKNLEQIHTEIELYIARNFPTKPQSVSEGDLKEMERLKKANSLVIGDKKYIEYDTALEFTERAVVETLRDFVKWHNDIPDFSKEDNAIIDADAVDDYVMKKLKTQPTKDSRDNAVEQEVKVKLLASINSFLAEQGIKDTDGTPLTFSPERF